MKHNLKFFLIAILLVAGVFVLAKYFGKKDVNVAPGVQMEKSSETPQSSAKTEVGTVDEELKQIENDIDKLGDDEFANVDVEVGI